MRLAERNKSDWVDINSPQALRNAFVAYLLQHLEDHAPVPFEGWTRFEVMSCSNQRNIPLGNLRAALPADLDDWADAICRLVRV